MTHVWFPLLPQVWGIPEGGLTENIAEPLTDLRGHERKVTLLRFHPTASNVLASVSSDNNIKLWDIEKGTEIINSSVHDQLVQVKIVASGRQPLPQPLKACGSSINTHEIQDIVWDYKGNCYTTTSKDKVLRIIDARTGAVAQVRDEDKASTCVAIA